MSYYSDNNNDGLPDPDRKRGRFSAKMLITEWLSIGDMWLQPNPEFRDEPHLLWRERELARDLEASAVSGRFTEEDKIRLRATFGEGQDQAHEPAVAEQIGKVIASLQE